MFTAMSSVPQAETIYLTQHSSSPPLPTHVFIPLQKSIRTIHPEDILYILCGVGMRADFSLNNLILFFYRYTLNNADSRPRSIIFEDCLYEAGHVRRGRGVARCRESTFT